MGVRLSQQLKRKSQSQGKGLCMQLSGGGVARGLVKNCRGEHRICREDTDTKDHRRDGRLRARNGEEEACRDFSDRRQWTLFSFGSRGILDEEPNMQINVNVEVGGAGQGGFPRPVLVGGGRGVVDSGLRRAEQTSCGACLGLSGSALPPVCPNYEASMVIAPSKKATGFCLLKWSPPANSAI